MPEYFNSDGIDVLVVSYDELVPRFYKTIGSLSAVVRRDEKRKFGMRRVSRGHNSGRALIEFDSLPLLVQEQMDDPRRDRHPVELFYKHNVEAERFFANYFLSDGRRISAEIRAKYTANAGAIEAILALKAERENNFARCGKRVPKLWDNLSKDAKEFKVIQEKIDGMAHNLPENPRRFQDKVMEYDNAQSKNAAFITLISDLHISNSIAGARKVYQRELDLFESIFRGIGYKPNYNDVYMVYNDFLSGAKEIVSNETGEVFDPNSFSRVSEATIRSYLAKWGSKAATLRLRTGDRQKLMGETKPYHSMRRPEFAGSLLSIDDRQPPFEYASGQRLWLYLGFDCGAGCYTTIVFGKDKEGIIMDFYRQMVRNYAEWGLPLPAELECESNLNASFKDTFLREGNMFQYVRIEANNARGKRIERDNRDMRYKYERKDEGWIARPFAKSEANRTGSDKVPMLPYEAIVERTLKHYEKRNNEPHPVRTEMTRWEFFMTRQHPDLKPINWFGIIPYLGFTAKSSCHTGFVRLNGGETVLGLDGKIALGDDLIRLMKIVEGQELNIKWLDGNDGQVLKAYAYIGDEYVCELLPKPTYARARIEQTEADVAARELMSSYVATIDGFGNTRKREIERVTIIENDTEPVEAEPSPYRFSISQALSGKERALYGVRQEKEPVEVIEDDHEFNLNLNNTERSFKSALSERF